jgi:hypothetical protein
MNQDTLHCVQGETYSCVLSKEKKIAVRVVSVLVVCGMRESVCYGIIKVVV